MSNPGRILLALSAVVALVCGGLLAWHQWWKPGTLAVADGFSTCGPWQDHEAGGEWDPIDVKNTGSESITLSGVHAETGGMRVPETFLVAGHEGVVDEAFGFADLAKDYPRIWSAQQSVEGFVLPPGAEAAVYVHLVWPAHSVRAVEEVSFSYRSASGAARTTSRRLLFADAEYSDTDECRA